MTAAVPAVPAAAGAGAAGEARSTTKTTTTSSPAAAVHKQDSVSTSRVQHVALPLFYGIGAVTAAVFAFTQLPVLVGSIALGAGVVAGFALRSYTLVPLLDRGATPTVLDFARTVGSVALALLVPCTAPYALPVAVAFGGALAGRNIPV